MFFVVLAVIFFSLAIFFKYQRKKFREKLLNPQEWQALVDKHKLSEEQQIKLCNSYNLPYKGNNSEPIDRENTSQDDEDEWKKYDSIEDWKNDLTVIWSGKTDDIEFSYRKDWDSPKERRKVTPHELVFDGNKRIYIKGLCHKRNETVHFNQEKIETKILAGSTRYDFEEWVERRLKVDVEALSDKHNVWI